MFFNRPQYHIVGAELVATAPWLDAPVRTSLLQCADRLHVNGLGACGDMTARDFQGVQGMTPSQAMDVLNNAPAISGWFGRKLRRAFKKAFQKTLLIAHKITHNKVFEAIHRKIQKMIPAPYNIFVKIHNVFANATHKFLRRITGGSKKAKKLGPIIADAARGLVSTGALKAAAKKLGIPASEAIAVASVTRLQNEVNAGKPAALATVRALHILDQASAGKPGAARQIIAEGALKKANPRLKAFNLHGKDGKAYRAIVLPIAA